MTQDLKDLIKKAEEGKKPDAPKLKSKEEERFCCVLSNPINFLVGSRKLAPNKEGFYVWETKEERAELEYQRKLGRCYLESDLT